MNIHFLTYHRTLFVLLLLFVIPTLFTACQTTTSKVSLPLRPLDAFISYHRSEATQIDGPRCYFYPSCSAYAQRAIRSHGFAGLFMILDRLLYREVGRLDRKYLPVLRMSSQHPLYYDPVEDSLPIFKVNRPSFLQEDFTIPRYPTHSSYYFKSRFQK